MPARAGLLLFASGPGRPDRGASDAERATRRATNIRDSHHANRKSLIESRTAQAPIRLEPASRRAPLCDGIVAGDTVVRPLHAYKVSLASGLVERPSGVAA